MGKGIGKLLLALTMLLGCYMGEPAVCNAEIVEGEAIIGANGLAAAREAAKHAAMRTFVEEKIGVKVSGVTEVEMGKVVRDNIVAKSNGYVRINGIVSEKQIGNMLVVKMDLSANEALMDTALKDVRTRLEALDDTSNHYGIGVAVTGFDADGLVKDAGYLNRLVEAKMQDQGFVTVAADAVRDYMSRNRNMDDVAISAEVRRIGRNNRMEENALLRGSISTVTVQRNEGYYTAKVLGQFELVGYDSNLQSSYAEYVVGIDASQTEAERKAEEMVVANAVSVLGQKALKVEQVDNRGGEKHLKLVLNFTGVTDRINQRNAIVNGLTQSQCRVLRSSFDTKGVFKVFVDATGYENTEELSSAILNNIGGLTQGITNEGTAGSTQLYFSL